MVTHAATSNAERLRIDTAGEHAPHSAPEERIALRPLQAADAGEAHALFDTHPDVWAFDPGRAYSRSEREAWARIKSCEWATPTGRLGIGCYAITRRDGGRMLGCAGLAASLVPGGLDAEPGAASALEVELYFRLGREHWGRGYATEACRTLVRLAFDTLGVRRLFCATSRAHDGALALMRRLGMEIDVRPLPGPFWGSDPARGILWNPRAVRTGRAAMHHADTH